MKKAADKFVRTFAAVLAVLSVSILLFTLVSTLFLNRTDKEWFGYKAFIVLSDSMSATDFSAGDLFFVRHVDPSTLQGYHCFYQPQRQQLRRYRHPQDTRPDHHCRRRAGVYHLRHDHRHRR